MTLVMMTAFMKLPATLEPAMVKTMVNGDVAADLVESFGYVLEEGLMLAFSP